jgi:hypothetical protein
MSVASLSFQLKRMGWSRRTMSSPPRNGCTLVLSRRLEAPHCSRSPTGLKQTAAADGNKGIDETCIRPDATTLSVDLPRTIVLLVLTTAFAPIAVAKLRLSVAVLVEFPMRVLLLPVELR